MMGLKEKIIIIFLIAFLPISAFNPKAILGQGKSQNIDYEQINPDSPLYNVKRLIEKIEIGTIYRGSPKFMTTILDRRFKELVYVNDKNLQSLIEQTTSRYNSTLGIITSQYKDKDPRIKNNAEQYSEILSKIRDKYPANSAYWLFVQQAIDSTKRLL